MSYITNQAINSRSMNGILTVTDGVATLEDGKLDCENVNVKTATVKTLTDSNLVNCSTSTTPLNNDSLVRKDYCDNNFMYKTNNIPESISGWKTFLNRVDLGGDTALVVGTGTSSFSGQVTFNTLCPISNTNATLTNHLTTQGYNDGRYIDFTTDQQISATNKRFNGLFCTGLSITPTLGGAGNRQQIYITGTELSFNPLFDNNYYRFYCRTNSTNQINPLEINYNTTTINNSLSGQRASFRTPTVNQEALGLFGTGTVDNRILFIPYSDGNLGYQNIFQNKDCGILFTSEQTIDRGAFCIAPWNSGSAGIRISVANVSIPGPFVSGGEASFNTWVNLKFRTRIYDLSSGSNYTQMYMLNGNEFVFAPNANGDKISFYCKDSVLGQLNTFISSALGNTSQVAFISNGQATFNNFCPISNVNPTAGNHLTRRDYIENNFVDKTSNQTIAGDKIFNGNATYNGSGLFCNCPGQFYNLVHLRNYTRVYDIASPFTSYTQLYMSGNNFVIYPVVADSSINFFCRNSGNFEVHTFISSATSNTSLVPFIASSTASFNNTLTLFHSVGNFSNIQQVSSTLNIENPTLNGTIKLKTRASVGAVQDSLILNTTSCDILSPTLNLTSSSTINIQSPNNLTGTINLFNTLTTGSLNIASSTSTTNFMGQATFNTVLPTSTITATSADEFVNYTTLTSQGFISSSSNINFTGFNTFQNYTTFKASLDLLDGTGTKSGNIIMASTGTLLINNNVPSGSINFSSDNSGGGNQSRATINENEFNFEVPLTLNINDIYYNPFNFGSNRLGYSMSNTGSTNTLTTGTGNNSGQLNIPAGSWNITYTGTITVITGTLTTLTDLEIFVADSFNNDFNIIGLSVLNYYKISSVPVGQKIKISASGNYISYTNVNTQLNLRLIANFTAGSGGLNFLGKISATRNA